jgi:hypothetical protein
MGSFKSVESYIAENPDNDSNNMRRNNILRKYYNDKRMEFDKDPVICSTGSFISEIPSISELVNVLLLCPSIAELIVSLISL